MTQRPKDCNDNMVSSQLIVDAVYPMFIPFSSEDGSSRPVTVQPLFTQQPSATHGKACLFLDFIITMKSSWGPTWNHFQGPLKLRAASTKQTNHPPVLPYYQSFRADKGEGDCHSSTLLNYLIVHYIIVWGFPEIGLPPLIIHYHPSVDGCSLIVFPYKLYKPSILGYPDLWKLPYHSAIVHSTSTLWDSWPCLVGQWPRVVRICRGVDPR